jgi:hypothetical protein
MKQICPTVIGRGGGSATCRVSELDEMHAATLTRTASWPWSSHVREPLHRLDDGVGGGRDPACAGRTANPRGRQRAARRVRVGACWKLLCECPRSRSRSLSSLLNDCDRLQIQRWCCGGRWRHVGARIDQCSARLRTFCTNRRIWSLPVHGSGFAEMGGLQGERDVARVLHQRVRGSAAIAFLSSPRWSTGFRSRRGSWCAAMAAIRTRSGGSPARHGGQGRGTASCRRSSPLRDVASPRGGKAAGPLAS